MSNYNQLILTYENGLQDVITLTDSTIPYGEYQYMNIAAVEVPEIVTNIGPYAFCDNNNLSAITLSEGLRVIEGQAFQHGVYSSVTIPSTVQSIGENSFNLWEEQMFGQAGDLYITCLATTPPMLSDWEGITFGLPEHLQAIYVPAGSVSAYQSAWSDYAAKIQALPTPPTPTTGFSTLDIVSAYVGTEIVERMYMGDELVWGDEPGPPTPVYSAMPLTFEIISAGTIVWRKAGNNAPSRTIQYSINNGSWQSITANDTAGTAINVSAGDVVQFKGNNTSYASQGSYITACRFAGTAKYYAYGNIMSLIYEDNFIDQTTLTANYTFPGLFFQATGLTSTSEHMLVLPATTLTKNCYHHMFYGCTNLTAAPELPSPTLANYSYSEMFGGCSKLAYIKCLATNISATNCTNAWVNGVASTGTFVKDANMTGWTTGRNGIPTNWTVQNA